MVEFSVIIPVFNERKNLPDLYEELEDLLRAENREGEVIWVNDGSTDGSGKWLQERVEGAQQLLELPTSFGQSAAMRAGVDHATGEVILFLDGDGQNDPADIPRLLNKFEEGYDLVSGWRKDREGSFLTRVLPSKIANMIISFLTGVELHDYGCSLKAYQASVLKKVTLYGELHRFLPALLSWYGVELCELEVNDRERTHGRSSYGLSRVWRVLLDLLLVKFLLDYRFRPIRVFGLISIVLFLAMVAGGGYLGYLKVAYEQSLSDHALTTVSVLCGLVSMQSLILGLLGEQQAIQFLRSTDEKPYHIRRKYNF